MERLNTTNINNPELTYKFFKERWKGMLHWCDWARYKELAKKFTGGKYLDAGCFNSPMPFELTRDYKRDQKTEIYAMDYCERMINELKAIFPEVKYCTGDVNKMEFSDGYFDYVVAGELIEHMESPKDTIAELMRVVKPGGTLALSTPLNEIQRGAVSDEHLWSYSSTDLIELLSPYGEVEITYYKDSVHLLVAFVKKNAKN